MNETQVMLGRRWLLVAEWLARQVERNDDVGYLARSFRGKYPQSVTDWMEWSDGIGSRKDQLYTRAMLEFNMEYPLDSASPNATADAARRAMAGKPPRFRANCPRSVGPRMRAHVMARDNFRCRRCGASSSDEGVRLVIDHIVPVAKGGGNEPTNLQVLCGDCNAGKTDDAPHAHDLRAR